MIILCVRISECSNVNVITGDLLKLQPFVISYLTLQHPGTDETAFYSVAMKLDNTQMFNVVYRGGRSSLLRS